MKIAISGKGGTGKTTISAGLALLFKQENRKVCAVDADPDTNLATLLGFPAAETITPICEMKELIQERTEAKEGIIFKLNPKVDDIPEKYCPMHNGIRLIVMGKLRTAKSGCYCPENAFLKALLSHLLLSKNEVIILDMPPGIEHLTRGTATNVDMLLIIIEPYLAAINTAKKIKKLADELHILKTYFVANKIRTAAEKQYIIDNILSDKLIGTISFYEELRDGLNEKILAEISTLKQVICSLFTKN